MPTIDDLLASCVEYANAEGVTSMAITLKPAPLGGRFVHAEVTDVSGAVSDFRSSVVAVNPPPPPDGGGNRVTSGVKSKVR